MLEMKVMKTIHSIKTFFDRANKDTVRNVIYIADRLIEAVKRAVNYIANETNKPNIEWCRIYS
jgi:hypothetical protein